MIPVSYTIIDVRAMMIEPLYTSVANITVPRPRSSHYLTIRAQV